MQKKQNQRSKANKKEINQQILNKFQLQEQPQVPSVSRRRLKKLCEVNQNEEVLSPSEGQDQNILQEFEVEPKYKQFGLKDDQQLQKERDAEENAKKNKKLKGNQQLDKFIQKQTAKTVKDKKEDKAKSNVQMTIEEMMRIKKQKKQARKSSDDFIVSDGADASQEIDERQLEVKRMAAYQKYNGSLQDEQKLIEKAMRLSLTASSIQKEESLNDFAYQKASKISAKTVIFSQKPVVPEKSVPKSQVKKQTKKQVKKTKTKEERTGPLADYVIVFSGEFEGYNKDQLIEVCEQLGAECPKSLVKKCNLLMQGSYVTDHFKRKTSVPVSQTQKSKQAKQRGIKIIPFEQLQNFFIQKTGVELGNHMNKNKVVSNPINPLNSFLFKPIESVASKQIPAQIKTTSAPNNKVPIKEEKMDIQKPINKAAHLDRRLWTEKYKPTKLQEVIGQSSQIKSLREWLECWEDIHIRGNKREVKETKGWNAAGSINSFAALLSGDPGIGKTSTARLLAMQYNYAVTEFNASDVRNKSGINLMETGSYNLDITRNLNKSLIIMDEVDGMSSGDRGGISAIINMIKSTKVPIICICNDRSSEKIRSLAAHCLDIKFHKPNKIMVVKRLRQILVEEGGSGQERALEQLVQTFQNDMRQILSYIEVIFKTVSHKITIDALSSKGKSSKDAAVMINHFDATRRLLNRTQFSRMSIGQRNDCFFIDSDMVPLMVHQNILSSTRKAQLNAKQFRNIVLGLQGIVLGDMLDKSIRKEQNWGLMPSYGFMTCVYPTEKISESIGFPAFPSWLGKNSSQRKMRRLSKQFKNAILPSTLIGNWKTAKSLYVPFITKQLAELLNKQLVQEAVILMQQYNLNPTIINEHLSSLYNSFDKSDKSNPLSQIPSAVKAKLTRLFNKRHQEAKLKQQATKAKAKVQHTKYNPIMQQLQQQIQEEAEQQGEVQVVVAKPKGKNKKK